MNEQIGWRGVLDRLGHEAPRYAQIFPELPRLLHQALQRQAQTGESAALLALLAEQRRTNRLLQALLWAAAGFVGGLLLTTLVLRWLH
jgi:ubiquinone biosynthesis protein